ncbi:MAG: DNA-processing protein DprA [Oscillospiraceae bacterium]|nr:DNA-processing protein DprA [Oscillospiraceae bacterium]
MSALKYWLWLATRSRIGVMRAKALIEYFGSPEKIYKAQYDDFISIENLKSTDVAELMDKDLTEAGRIQGSCIEIGCRAITLHDSNYPERLRNIYDPPLVIYVKGNLPYIDDECVIGVVGSRTCTPYGITAAESLGYELSKNNIIVSTGLARGIDTAAARGALRGGYHIIGVVASGLDIVFPSENKALFNDVISSGAIVSEYPPGTPALKHHFPSRNRIISGLSLGVAVIEAPKRSGALITASRAIEHNRDVFVLPGNVDAIACQGSNALLREGAIPFMSAEDIIEEYKDSYNSKITDVNSSNQKKSFDNKPKVDYIDLGAILEKLDGDEKVIVKSIGNISVSIDDIILNTNIPAQKVLASLTMLELSKYVCRDDSGNWKIAI